MTTTTNLPAGITSFDHPCWELVVVATDRPYGMCDGIPHYDTEAEAVADARCMAEARVEDDPLPELKPHQLAAPCWTATAACGEHIEGDTFTLDHHVNGKDALREALDCDFVVLDGVLRCDDREFCEPKVATA
jgi:hypothetical protein